MTTQLQPKDREIGAGAVQQQTYQDLRFRNERRSKRARLLEDQRRRRIERAMQATRQRRFRRVSELSRRSLPSRQSLRSMTPVDWERLNAMTSRCSALRLIGRPQ